jgi:glutamate synthase (NADPH/NADH) large chain
LAENITEFYICSMSCRSVVYKGLFLAEQLAIFYPDLQDDRFVSSFAVFHQRYSTNTWPAWKLAQPFRTLAHNGEINTLRGNVNWMKSHETRMVADVFGAHNEDLKPVIEMNMGAQLQTIRSRYGTYAITGNHEFIGGVDAA